MRVPAPASHDVIDFDSVSWGLGEVFIGKGRLRCLLKEPWTKLNKVKEVYLATSAEIVQKVAMKFVTSQWRIDAGITARIVHEMTTSPALSLLLITISPRN